MIELSGTYGEFRVGYLTSIVIDAWSVVRGKMGGLVLGSPPIGMGSGRVTWWHGYWGTQPATHLLLYMGDKDGCRIWWEWATPIHTLDVSDGQVGVDFKVSGDPVIVIKALREQSTQWQTQPSQSYPPHPVPISSFQA